MKNSILLALLIVSGIFQVSNLNAATQEGTNVIIPYSIDFTQVKSLGLPNAANADYTYKTWTKLYPSDWSKGAWVDTTWDYYYLQNDNGTKKRVYSGLCATGHHNGAADAWTVTPALYLEKGKSYEITYTYKRFPGIIQETSEPLFMTEKFEVGFGEEKSEEGLKKCILNTYEVDNDEYKTGTSIVTIENSGIYYVGIHLISDAVPQPITNMTYLCLGSFSIQEKIVIHPNSVTDFSVSPDPDKKLSARLNWTNPSEWTNGESITEKMEVEIYRNNELIQTLSDIEPDSSSEYNDVSVPQAGLYEYAVRIKIGDKYSLRTIAEQCEVGNLLLEATLPYQIDFTQSEPYGKPDEANPTCTWEKWMKINPVASSAGVWAEQIDELQEGETKSGICAYCQHTDTADAWVISPTLFLQQGKAYAVTYSYKKFPATNQEHKEKFEVSIGTAKTVDALKQNIFAEYEVKNGEYRVETLVLKIEEAGNYNIGFHCISTPVDNNTSSLCLGRFSIEETTVVTPDVITKPLIKASTMDEYVANLSWINPTKGTKNEILAGPLTAKIFRDEELIETLVDIEPGAEMAWSDKVNKEGRYTYAVSIGYRGIYGATILLGDCKLEPFVPLRVTDLTGNNEGRNITLTWTNPSSYSKGDKELTENMFVDIYRDTQLISTIENQIPGSNGEYKEIVPSDKVWIYWVVCRLANGAKSTSSNVVRIDLTPIIKPAPVIDLKAETDTKKEFQINVSWTNPIRGTSNEDLTGKQFKAQIFKNKELIETLLYLNAGSKTEWTDHVEKEGSYLYAVTVEMDKINSDTVEVSCYAGYFRPASITEFSFKMQEGKTVLKWKNPDKDEYGNELKDNMLISLYCNEQIVATFEDQAPGSSGEYRDEFNPGDRKVYFLTSTLPNGASSSRSKTLLVNDVTNISKESTTPIYYDSSTGLLHVGKAASVAIYNASGVCILKKNKVSEPLSFKELPNGIYFVKVGPNEKVIRHIE